MESFTSPSQTHKKEFNSKENFIKKTLPTPPTTISRIILQNEDSSESGGQFSQKCSTKKLCQIYLQKVAIKSPCEFYAKDLIQATNIKLRRLYDLLNILSGCGYIQRISKGKYQSFTLEEAQQTINEQTQFQQTSLISMSYHVKKILIQSQDFKSFRDICSEIFELHVSKNINIESLKRRIYECCKILRMLGLVQKNGTIFKWKGIYATIVADSSENQQSKKSRRKKNRRQENKSKQTQWQKQIIDIVLNKITNENQLNIFVDALKNEYSMKADQVTVKRQLKYD